MKEIEILYQNRNGEYLCDALQPLHKHGGNVNAHNSTRYINIKEAGLSKALPELYAVKELCCGCSACMYACPKSKTDNSISVTYLFLKDCARKEEFFYTGAISMFPDEEGFLYPVVDDQKCIRCYKCISVCPFKE